MIDYVHRGQQLNSGLLNGIIKQANGQTKPTDGLFRNTTQGSLFINDEKLKQQPYNYNQFLDIRTTPRMLSGEMYPYYDVYLGMELSSSLNEFPITYSDPTGRSQYLSRIPYIGSWILQEDGDVIDFKVINYKFFSSSSDEPDVMELSDVGTKKFTTSYGDGWFPTFAKATDSEIFASLVSLSSDSAPYRLFNGLIISNVDFRRLLTLDMRSFDIRMTRDGYEKDNVKVCGIRQVSQLGTRSEQTIRGICDFQKEHTFSDEDVRFDIEPWDYQKTPWDTSSYCLRIMSPYVQDGDEMKTIKNEFHAVPLPPPQENNDPIYTGVYVSKISGEISAGIISDLTSFDNEEFQNRCKLSGFIPVSLLYLQHSEYSTESLTSSIRSGNNDIQEIYYYTRSPSFCKGKLNGPFEISGGYFVNCYYQQEQYISQMEPQEILSSYTSSFVWIEVDYSSEASATTQLTSGPLSAYNDSVMNPMKCVAPLYKFDNEGSVECDLRLIPHIQQWTDKSVISARV